jgi:hypothetical protein
MVACRDSRLRAFARLASVVYLLALGLTQLDLRNGF